jgi:hypothetical protein
MKAGLRVGSAGDEVASWNFVKLYHGEMGRRVPDLIDRCDAFST